MLLSRLALVFFSISTMTYNFQMFTDKLFLKTTTTLLEDRHDLQEQDTEHLGTCFMAKFTADAILKTLESPLKWALDLNGTMRYVGDGQVHAIDNKTVGKFYRSHIGYQQCLAKKHVVLIGDSRVRYQYIALADYLATGEWPRCEDYRDLDSNNNQSAFNKSANCFLIDHESSKGWTWNDWYDMSSRALNDTCDCHRHHHFLPRHTHENRYFGRSTPYGQLRLTFLLNFVDRILFHSEFPPLSPWESGVGSNHSMGNASLPSRCAPGECYHAPAIKLSTSNALLQIVPQLACLCQHRLAS